MAQTKTKPEQTQTEQVIASMLTENTGRHFLDSGGAYGRHWEQNQERDFSKEERCTLDGSYAEISVTHNVYHWLVDRLEYNEELDNEFRQWAEETEERRENHWLALMEEWCDDLKERGHPITSMHGDDSRSCMIVNTYNGEDLLSQTLQYAYFELDGESYILLQIHGGCDVRGGYTSPHVFEVNGPACMEGTEIFDNARAALFCNGVEKNPNQTEIPGCEAVDCELSWYTDDGHSWYSNDQNPDLGDYPTTKESDGEEWTTGHVHFTESGVILCPGCGGKLGADFY